MGGYLMGLDSIDSLSLYAKNGIYATKISPPSNGAWKTHHEATFADYITMQPGDNIYFFIKRKIYGIGELVAVGTDCKYLNHPKAINTEEFSYSDIESLLLWDEGDVSKNQPWICLFKPSPHFFMRGIDMDDMLSSNPQAFRILPAFWKVSFIKFDNDENQAFRSALLKLNEQVISDPTPGMNIYEARWQKQHKAVLAKVKKTNYCLNPKHFLDHCAEDRLLRHEMAIELAILFQLSSEDHRTIDIFGKWDYLSHQVVASPFKPVDYMDRMDIFGYSFITGYEPTKARFLIVEIKKGEARAEDIEQLMNYVDWVKDEYCFGDYSMIRGFLVASSFNIAAIRDKSEIASRRFIVGRRPAVSREWSELVLVEYNYNHDLGRLDFTQR
ncbi:MAG: hypothetical protein AB9903_12270 [Vulcanimicrobiota bacterium]